MASVNRVIIVGNLGRDPEMRYTADGAAICSLSIATSSSSRDRQTGKNREDTEWHRVVLFRRLAEVAGEYLKKGRSVYIEGRLKTRKWQDQNGIDRYTTEIIADQMQMLGSREQDDNRGAQLSNADRSQAATEFYRPAQAGKAPEDLDSDIPF